MIFTLIISFDYFREEEEVKILTNCINCSPVCFLPFLQCEFLSVLLRLNEPETKFTNQLLADSLSHPRLPLYALCPLRMFMEWRATFPFYGHLQRLYIGGVIVGGTAGGGCQSTTIIEHILQLFHILKISNHRLVWKWSALWLANFWLLCSIFFFFSFSPKKGRPQVFTSKQDVITSLCQSLPLQFVSWKPFKFCRKWSICSI